MRSLLLVLVFCHAFSGLAGATEITQWAVEATASSEYGSTGYSAHQATGEPDVYPRYGDIREAWASMRSNAGVEWLDLTYPKAVWIRQVQVYETYNPGAVVGLEIYDSSGKAHLVWQRRPQPAPPARSHIFEINIEPPQFSAQRVRVILDTASVSGWNEIDAVGIIGYMENPHFGEITTSIKGEGTVVFDPEDVDYSVGTEVQLTALPKPGWSFDGWEGDLRGRSNPAELIVDKDKLVTAIFTQNKYTIMLQSRGNGSADLRPDQLTHHYGDQVQFVAVAEPGWRFFRWEGDLTGSDNPVAVRVQGNKRITAVFSQLQHNLTVTTTGSGSVRRIPDQVRYPHGAQVVMIAEPEPGWVFERWGGALLGTENPEAVTLEADTVVVAVFVQEEAFVPTIDEAREPFDYGAWDDYQVELVSLVELDEIIATLGSSLEAATARRAGHPAFLEDLGEILRHLQSIREKIEAEISEQMGSQW